MTRSVLSFPLLCLAVLSSIATSEAPYDDERVATLTGVDVLAPGDIVAIPFIAQADESVASIATRSRLVFSGTATATSTDDAVLTVLTATGMDEVPVYGGSSMNFVVTVEIPFSSCDGAVCESPVDIDMETRDGGVEVAWEAQLIVESDIELFGDVALYDY